MPKWSEIKFKAILSVYCAEDLAEEHRANVVSVELTLKDVDAITRAASILNDEEFAKIIIRPFLSEIHWYQNPIVGNTELNHDEMISNLKMENKREEDIAGEQIIVSKDSFHISGFPDYLEDYGIRSAEVKISELENLKNETFGYQYLDEVEA